MLAMAMEDAPLFPLSFSKVASFRRCRKQYWLEYLSGQEKPPDPMNPPGIVGKGVHLAMHNLCDSDDPEVARDELDRYLRMPAHDVAGPGTEWHDLALRLFEAGVEAHDSIQGEDRWSEKDTWVPYPAGRVSVSARIDRIDYLGDNRWQIVDWKTNRVDNDEATDSQLDLGHLAMRVTLKHYGRGEKREAVVRAIAWNLRTGQQRVRLLTRDDAVATLKKYAALARRIQANEDFTATRGRYCGFCRWQPACPESEPTLPADWEDVEPDEGEDESAEE
jgi:RecB family exonuclease